MAWSLKRGGRGGAREAPRGEQRPALHLLLCSLLPTLVLFGTLEAGLRLTGFEFRGVPTHLRFGPNLQDDLERDLLVPDPALFWRLRVDPAVATTLERRRVLHPLLPGPDGRLPPARPSVVALGDSCTFFGRPSWPERLETLLREGASGAAVWNASVPGYSSYQGRRLFEEEVAALRPDWVVVYFGWNDHWLGQAKTDRLVGLERLTALSVAPPLFEDLRVVQAGRAFHARVSTPPPARRPLRVPPEEYAENLEAICRVAGSLGAGVALVTAPGDLDGNDAARLETGGYAAPGTDLAALHARYNAIVRDVAGACGAELVDFAAAAPPGSVGADGIHLTPDGIAWLAARLSELMGESPRKAGSAGR